MAPDNDFESLELAVLFKIYIQILLCLCNNSCHYHTSAPIHKTRSKILPASSELNGIELNWNKIGTELK